MPFKIQFNTNLDKEMNTLDKESLTKMINILEDSYKNIRNELYNYFLGKRSWRYAISTIVIWSLFFLLTQDIFYLEAMFVSILLLLITSIILAEVSTRAIKKELKERITVFKARLESLKRKEELNGL